MDCGMTPLYLNFRLNLVFIRKPSHCPPNKRCPWIWKNYHSSNKMLSHGIWSYEIYHVCLPLQACMLIRYPCFIWIVRAPSVQPCRQGGSMASTPNPLLGGCHIFSFTTLMLNKGIWDIRTGFAQYLIMFAFPGSPSSRIRSAVF